MVNVGERLLIDGRMYRVENAESERIYLLMEGCRLMLTRDEFENKLSRKEIIRCQNS